MQRIGILRGGVSPEFQFSLKTGAAVQRALAESGFDAIDMLLDKDGMLHIRGIPADLEKAQASVDLIWNALHGTFGEDGQIQRLLDQYGIPYTGAGAVSSALAFNKEKAKERAHELGINTPPSILIIPEGGESVAEVTRKIYETMAPPWVVKPLSGGASIRSYFAFTPLELSQFVDDCLAHGEPFIAEQYIFGKEAAVGVINDFRNQSEYVLPVVEVKSSSRGILEHEHRSQPGYAIAGGSLRADEREKLAQYAKQLHETFDAQDYSQSEFIIDAQGKVWFIELDTHPHLTEHAPFLVALEAVGATLQEFVKSIIERKK